MQQELPPRESLSFLYLQQVRKPTAQACKRPGDPQHLKLIQILERHNRPPAGEVRLKADPYAHSLNTKMREVSARNASIPRALLVSPTDRLSCPHPAGLGDLERFLKVFVHVRFSPSLAAENQRRGGKASFTHSLRKGVGGAPYIGTHLLCGHQFLRLHDLSPFYGNCPVA